MKDKVRSAVKVALSMALGVLIWIGGTWTLEKITTDTFARDQIKQVIQVVFQLQQRISNLEDHAGVENPFANPASTPTPRSTTPRETSAPDTG